MAEPPAQDFKDPKNVSIVKQLMERLRRNPDDVPARIDLGKVYLRENLVAQADEQFKLALKAAPDDPTALLLSAVTIQKLPNPDNEAALAMLQKAAGLAPRDADVHLNLGLLLALLNRDAKAESELKLAVTLTDHPLALVSAHLGLMDIYKNRGEKEKADLEYQAACAIYPDLPAQIGREEINQLTPAPVFVEDLEVHPALEKRKANAQKQIEKLKHEKKK